MKAWLTGLAMAGSLGAGAHAQGMDQAQAVARLLIGNAALQVQVANGLDSGRLAPLQAGALQQQSARLFRLEAEAFALGGQPEDLRAVLQLQDELAQALAQAGTAPATARRARDYTPQPALDALRDAEQQHRLARGWASGTLNLRQVAELEDAQSQIGAWQQRVQVDGRLSPEAAMTAQHLRNLQDWAIFSGEPAL
jgi:hypothetical protein